MITYKAIYNEIQRRYEAGEITYEQACDVNDLAYEKYVVERYGFDSSIEKDNLDKFERKGFSSKEEDKDYKKKLKKFGSQFKKSDEFDKKILSPDEYKKKMLEFKKINKQVTTESSNVQYFTVKIGNRTFNVNNFTDKEIDESCKKDITNKISTILKNEKKIINSVYKLYKPDYGDNYEKDKDSDYISSFEIVDAYDYPGKYNIGILFSSLNQFYTMFYNGKIIEKSTHIY